MGFSLEKKKEILNKRKWKFPKRRKQKFPKRRKRYFLKRENGGFNRKWKTLMRENRNFTGEKTEISCPNFKSVSLTYRGSN